MRWDWQPLGSCSCQAVRRVMSDKPRDAEHPSPEKREDTNFQVLLSVRNAKTNDEDFLELSLI